MVLDSGNSEFMGPENWVLGPLPASLPKPFFEPPPNLHRPTNCNQLFFVFFFFFLNKALKWEAWWYLLPCLLGPGTQIQWLKPSEPGEDEATDFHNEDWACCQLPFPCAGLSMASESTMYTKL